MIRTLKYLLAVAVAGSGVNVRADSVTDWNDTICTVMQHDGNNMVNKANPGWTTRAMAMMNGAIYDVFQAKQRTNVPFLVNTTAVAGASLDAAVNQAAYEVLKNTYPGESSVWQPAYDTRMGLIANDINKTNGMVLGSQIAQAYIAARTNDHSGDTIDYMPQSGPGKWRPDPFHPDQKAWGPAWGTVNTFAIGPTQPYVADLTPPPDLNTQAYKDAYDQVKRLGAVNSGDRSATQTEIGLFWGYDRATMGPPPVLFDRNLVEISNAAGNSTPENARMFAMASVAMADAAIAAWDAKFSYNYWRPVTAIHEAGNDGSGFDDTNPNTVGDVNWRPLGAPGKDANDFNDDFTPPFPSWTSGHATMGGATFKALELFYKTNIFEKADMEHGSDMVTDEYNLTSQEFAVNHAVGMARPFHSFTQDGILDEGTENSPEGENGMSRVYLGIHWIFDQRDGIELGNAIANYVNGHYFQAVPEPGTFALVTFASMGCSRVGRRRDRSQS